jgi:hypothetical protein
MKNRLVPGIAVAVLGLLIALVPAFIFPTCTTLVETAAGGAMPMKCLWSGRAEIGVGLLILCGGALLIVFKAPLIRIGISIMTALAGFLGLLIPALLIGGCGMATMTCRMTTFPALYVLTVLTMAACAANAVYLWKYGKKRLDGGHSSIEANKRQGKADGQ